VKKSNAGFTLIELIAAIAAVAVLLAASAGFMLQSMRMEQRSRDTAQRQQTVRTVLAMVEKLAVGGDIRSIENIGNSWVLYSEENQPLLQYLEVDGSLRAGGSVLMGELKSASAEMDGKLFTISIETEYGEYKTSVYCRFGDIEVNDMDEEAIMSDAGTGLDNADGTRSGRMQLLTVLCSQYGSMGEILGHTKTDAEPWAYFSEWYIRQQQLDVDFGGSSDWNENTPWCACFISWGAAQNEWLDNSGPDRTAHYFAAVSNGVEKFKNDLLGGEWLDGRTVENLPTMPAPGDLVFFSWDGDSSPEHVGALLHTDGNNIYTIEGNSGGRVTVNRYPTDSEYIVGYAVLDWQPE